MAVPSEVFRIFVAFLFILAFSRYGPKPSNPPSALRLRLDRPCRGPIDKTTMDTWVQQGGIASIAYVMDILDNTAVSALRCVGMSFLNRMNQWGLAQRFIGILNSFLAGYTAG